LPVDYKDPTLTSPSSSGTETATPADPAPVSSAVKRFQSCRWRRPAEDGVPEGCGHRDVLPITGTHGFDPEAWCNECTFFKLRRTPKKRQYDSY
jgi:hypothetical protein